MEHLKGLCQVLEMRVSEAMGETPLEAKTGIEQAVLAKLRNMSAAKAELLLALADEMETKKK